MLEWSDVTKRYPGSSVPALDSVRFDVQDGEVVGLVGLNGAGKTTAIRAACGVILPTAGTVRIDGRDIVRDKAPASTRIGWVPELPNCDPDRRALPTLCYFAGFYGESGSSATAHCRDLLKSVGLEGTERTKLRRFSQGMFKRFNLAAAMVGDPTNLLLDEVLNGIDPQGIQFVRDWTLRLKAEHKAVLLSSHQLTEVQRVADRVAILHRGKLLRVIRKAELENVQTGETRFRLRIQSPNDECRRFLETLGHVTIVGDTITLVGRNIDSVTLNKELVQRGYAVAEIQIEATPLEDYFLRLIGDAG